MAPRRRPSPARRAEARSPSGATATADASSKLGGLFYEDGTCSTGMAGLNAAARSQRALGAEWSALAWLGRGGGHRFLRMASIDLFNSAIRPYALYATGTAVA